MSIGAILQTSAFSVQQMIVARIITGVFSCDCSSFIYSSSLIPGVGNGLVSCQTNSLLVINFIPSINTATAPIWQSETSKPTWRGKLVVFEMMYVAKQYTE